MPQLSLVVTDWKLKRLIHEVLYYMLSWTLNLLTAW